MNRELVGVDNWLNDNRLSLNSSKTYCMIISNQKNVFYSKIKDTILTKVSTVKFLDVTLDENRNFNDHVNRVTTKTSMFVKKGDSLLWPGAKQWRIYYHRMWDQLSTTCSK